MSARERMWATTGVSTTGSHCVYQESVSVDLLAFEPVDDHQPRLRHVLDRVAQSFAAESGAFTPPYGMWSMR